MRILLTGATGFVGSHVARQLLEYQHEVAALVRPQSNLWRISDLLPRLNVIDGDMRELDHAADVIRTFAPDATVHLAWFGVASRHRNDPAQIENVHATVKLVELARAAGCHVWVGLGSQAEYGISDLALCEDMPTDPVTLYGAAKLSACVLAQRLCDLSQVRFVWLRLFSAYGPAEDHAWLIPYVILGLLRGQMPALTAGLQRWDYIFIEDVARAVHLAVTDRTMRGIYNIGSGETHTIRSIIERVRDLIDPRLSLVFDQVAYRPDQVMHLEADITRLCACGWSPRVGLEEGLWRTVSWFRENLRYYE